MSFFSKATAVVASFSAGAALANKVNGTVSQTQQAFNKLKFGDVTGAASAAGYKPISKFKNNDYTSTPSKLLSSFKDTLQEKGHQVKTFPTDLGQYYIKMTFSSYERTVALIEAKADPKLTVLFPIPTNLSEPFSVNYREPKLGPILGAVAEQATKMYKGGEVGLNEVGGMIKESGAVLARSGVSAMKGGETLVANIDKATGFVPNPHLAAIFEDLGLREHSFTFRFSPKNKQEADDLKSIIKAIRRRMLPGIGEAAQSSTGPVFTFPDTVELAFCDKAQLYPIKKSVLTNMVVNYAPNGAPAFYKSGDPTDVEISMTFKEIEVVTRDDYKESE